MAKERKSQGMKQSLEMTMNPRKICKDIVPSYIGKNIVLEEGDIDTDISSGRLEKYDGRFLLLKDYKKHCTTLSRYYGEGSLKENLHNDIENIKSVRYSLPQRLINVNIIASIHSLDDVLDARERIEQEQK